MDDLKTEDANHLASFGSSNGVPARNNVPLYHTVYLVLREQLLEGQYSLGIPIPPEVELAKIFSVSRITIRRALEELHREGLIDRKPGKGTFAVEHPSSASVTEERMSSNLIENLVALGRKTKVRVASFQYVPVPPAIGSAMGLAPGDMVQRVERIRIFRKAPFSYLLSYVPEDVGRSFTEADVTTLPLLSLLERAGVAADSAEQEISATLAMPGIAAALEIPVGSPLLSITRLVRDTQSRAVEYLKAYYRPELYSYRMRMIGGQSPRPRRSGSARD